MDELQLCGSERWSAVVAMVEGVEGERLEVIPMSFDAHCSHFVKGGDDLVAGVIEDPFSGKSNCKEK